MLGLNGFYYELGVQIIDVCLQTRQQNQRTVDATVINTNPRTRISWCDSVNLLDLERIENRSNRGDASAVD